MQLVLKRSKILEEKDVRIKTNEDILKNAKKNNGEDAIKRHGQKRIPRVIGILERFHLSQQLLFDAMHIVIILIPHTNDVYIDC